MHLTRVNSHSISPIRLPTSGLPIKGGDLLADPFGTVFIVAKRRSGKTNVINHLIKHCITKDTTVVVFCSSCYNDQTWIEIRKWLKKKNINYHFFKSIWEGGENQIHSFVDDLAQKAEERERLEDEEYDQAPPQEQTDVNFIDSYFGFKNEDNDEEVKPAKRKPKFLAPDYLFIFDDISTELKNPSVTKLFKEARHYKARVIASSQYLLDIEKSARSQVQTWLIFKDQPVDKLKQVHEAAEVHIPFDSFFQMYKVATKPTKKEPCPFFYIDSSTGEFRRNFNLLFT